MSSFTFGWRWTSDCNLDCAALDFSSLMSKTVLTIDYHEFRKAGLDTENDSFYVASISPDRSIHMRYTLGREFYTVLHSILFHLRFFWDLSIL